MTIEKRLEITEELFKRVKDLAKTKGKAYSGTEDTLSNFKRSAERTGATKFQVILIYMDKHYDSIMNAIKAHPDNPIEQTEGMHSRILDLINYLTILACMLEEEQKDQNSDLQDYLDLMRLELQESQAQVKKYQVHETI
jgi:hypothetical protein